MKRGASPLSKISPPLTPRRVEINQSPREVNPFSQNLSPSRPPKVEINQRQREVETFYQNQFPAPCELSVQERQSPSLKISPPSFVNGEPKRGKAPLLRFIPLSLNEAGIEGELNRGGVSKSIREGSEFINILKGRWIYKYFER